jgi:hypothetical protein
MIARRSGKRVYLGNGEILVVGATGTAFLAPTLIFHYVAEHGYRPPAVFAEALRVSDPTAGVPLDRETYQMPVWLEAFDDAVSRYLRWQEEAPDDEPERKRQ